MIDYRLDLSLAHAHRFLVTLRVKPTTDQLVVSLPAWIPGSYLVREFARHVNHLHATQNARACDITQLDKARWKIRCNPGQMLTVCYEVYAFDTSVRAAYLDSQRGFFNGTSVFLRVHGHENMVHQVQLQQLPKGWDVATSMPARQSQINGKTSRNRFIADNYDALVDHPVEMGHFWRGQFTVRGIAHELVVTGAAPSADLHRLLADTQRICETQIDFWHGHKKAAFDHYTFLLNVVDDGYGGLEHRNSTALICARRDLPRLQHTEQSDGYITLLGLISHEYFHTWNVKRLKPQEFSPYDYTQENYTCMLWFFEGFTSYYDDVCLLRAGLITPSVYLKLLAKPINQVLASPGRHVQSVAQASFDAWVRYYRPDENTANTTVSYYTKGALLALALDLTLRTLPVKVKASKGAASRPNATPKVQPASLDGVMRRLWALQRPIAEADVAQALDEEAGSPPPGFSSWMHLLKLWVYGTDDLPLSALLASVGVQWKTITAPLSQKIGVRLSETPGGLKVSAVMRGSPAEAAGLCAGDELLALDGWRLKRQDDWQALATSPSLKPLLISRDQRLHTLSLPLLDSGPTAWCQVIQLDLENTPPTVPAGKDANSKGGSSRSQQPPSPSTALIHRKRWLGC